MSTLNNSKRFFRPSPIPIQDLPTIPFDFSTPTPQSHRQPASRFSADTVIVKSPPLLSRMFSTKESSASSPLSSPLRSARLGHAASASESRIKLSSLRGANAFNDEDDDGTNREELVEPSGNHHFDQGKNWPTGVAKELFDHLARRRRASLHSRKSSTSSISSNQISLPIRLDTSSPPLHQPRKRASKSFGAATAPCKPVTALSAPPRAKRTQTMAATPPPNRALPSVPVRSDSPAPLKLHDLPPRSDSRAAQIAPIPLKNPARKENSPARVEISPLVIPPRRINPTTTSTKNVSANTAAPPPFRVLLSQAPTRHSVRTKSNASLLVTLNVGGTIFTSSVDTLTRNSQGGKLGEFIESIVEQVKLEAKREEIELQKSAETSKKLSFVSIQTEQEAVQDSILNDSHFTMSAYPSRLHDDDYPLGVHEKQSGCIQVNLGNCSSAEPSSPIDPFEANNSKTIESANRLKLPLPNFSAPPSALTPKPVNITPPAKEAQLVTSPLPHLRVKSIHPELIACPTQTYPLSPQPRPVKYSPPAHFRQSNCSELSFESETCSVGMDKDLSHRLHLSDELNPFERALGPYFAVLKEQRIAQAKTENPGGVPHQNVKLNIPNRKAKSTKPSTTGSRPPSLSNSLSTDDEQIQAVSAIASLPKKEEERDFTIFLDRSPENYSAILRFLREGILPTTRLVPASESAPGSTLPEVETSVLDLLQLNPSSLLNWLASLRSLTQEAKWLGIDTLVAACDAEHARLNKVVKWLKEAGQRDAVEQTQARRKFPEPDRKVREKAGWI